jgi:hypothetical protein
VAVDEIPSRRSIAEISHVPQPSKYRTPAIRPDDAYHDAEQNNPSAHNSPPERPPE